TVVSGAGNGTVNAFVFHKKKVFAPAGVLGRNRPIVVAPVPSQLPAIPVSPMIPSPAMVSSGGLGGFDGRLCQGKNVSCPAALFGRNKPIDEAAPPVHLPATGKSPATPMPEIEPSGAGGGLV